MAPPAFPGDAESALALLPTGSPAVLGRRRHSRDSAGHAAWGGGAARQVLDRRALGHDWNGDGPLRTPSRDARARGDTGRCARAVSQGHALAFAAVSRLAARSLVDTRSTDLFLR